MVIEPGAIAQRQFTAPVDRHRGSVCYAATFSKPHMTRAWSRGRITGASKRLQLLRYPRSKPICATRPVSEHGQPHMRSPLIAAAPRSRFRRAGLRETKTILESGIYGPGVLRFGY